VATSQTTTSTSYTDLTTAGPAVSVTIPASGNALVIVTAKASNSGTDNDNLIGFAISGNTSVAASDARSLLVGTIGGNSNPRAKIQASATYLVTGLTSGTGYTFRAKYRAIGGTCTFTDRNIIVWMMP